MVWDKRSRSPANFRVMAENLKTHANGIPVAPPLPNPPHSTDTMPHRATTPSPRPASPRPKISRRRPKKSPEAPQLPAGLLDGAVPPINVLIVEDNIINLKLLEAFLKRLKVRWRTAMNGREAVTKWRAGGFHLVLMDIQLPVMNGLDATKEIRRLERLNNIGVLSGSASNTLDCETTENGRKAEGEDCLTNRNLFKSPVIIVALTASSLQSDRHEALAAGCNDFLTKVCSSFSQREFFFLPSCVHRGITTRLGLHIVILASWLEAKVRLLPACSIGHLISATCILYKKEEFFFS